MKIAIAIVSLHLICAASVAAQDTGLVAAGDARPVLRPDGTYFFNHLPSSKLVFEGQIAPRIIIIDSIADAADRVLEGGTHWGMSLSTTPMVKLRMFREASSPVRTPSYMPKGNIQFLRLRNLNADATPEKVAFQGPIETLFIDIIPFGHHSNGQNGCLFTNQTRNAEGECVVTSAGPAVVNKVDGSFSTNYVEAGVHYGRLHLRSGPDDFRTKAEWRVGGGVQLNPSGFLGGGIDDELKDLYGQTRVFFEANTAVRDFSVCGRAESTVNLQYIRSAPASIPSLIASIEGTCLPKKWGGSGLFFKFYRGQDYYNLGFAEKIQQLQFGFTLQRATFLSFAIP